MEIINATVVSRHIPKMESYPKCRGYLCRQVVFRFTYIILTDYSADYGTDYSMEYGADYSANYDEL